MLARRDLASLSMEGLSLKSSSGLRESEESFLSVGKAATSPSLFAHLLQLLLGDRNQARPCLAAHVHPLSYQHGTLGYKVS